MSANGPECAQEPPDVFHLYRREHRHPLSFEDFFLLWRWGETMRQLAAVARTRNPDDQLPPAP
jgi:hypothetical protein